MLNKDRTLLCRAASSSYTWNVSVEIGTHAHHMTTRLLETQREEKMCTSSTCSVLMRSSSVGFCERQNMWHGTRKAEPLVPWGACRCGARNPQEVVRVVQLPW